jgi:hypothetical protein
VGFVGNLYKGVGCGVGRRVQVAVAVRILKISTNALSHHLQSHFIWSQRVFSAGEAA